MFGSTGEIPPGLDYDTIVNCNVAWPSETSALIEDHRLTQHESARGRARFGSDRTVSR